MGNLKDVSRILVKLFLVCPHIAQERFLYSYSSATGDIPVNTELLDFMNLELNTAFASRGVNFLLLLPNHESV